MRRAEIDTRVREFESLCRAQALPLTVQRRAILRAVLERDDHPTADQVYDSVRERLPGLSRTTVYRVLETLVGLGLVRRLQHAGTAVRFDGNVGRHHHLVCRVCNGVTDIEVRGLDGLELPPVPRGRFEIEDYSVHFTGVCPRCRRKNKRP